MKLCIFYKYLGFNDERYIDPYGNYYWFDEPLIKDDNISIL